MGKCYLKVDYYQISATPLKNQVLCLFIEFVRLNFNNLLLKICVRMFNSQQKKYILKVNKRNTKKGVRYIQS